MSEAASGAVRSHVASAGVRGAPRVPRRLLAAAGFGLAAILPLFLGEGSSGLENMAWRRPT